MPGMGVFHYCCVAAASPGGAQKGPLRASRYQLPSLGDSERRLWHLRTFL